MSPTPKQRGRRTPGAEEPTDQQSVDAQNAAGAGDAAGAGSTEGRAATEQTADGADGAEGAESTDEARVIPIDRSRGDTATGAGVSGAKAFGLESATDPEAPADAADRATSRHQGNKGQDDPTITPRSVPQHPVEAALGQLLRDAASQVGGVGWQQRVESGLAFLRRRLTGDYDVDELGFDAELTDTVLLATLRPLFNEWFRTEVRGAEHIPDTGGALLVANHSGTLPLDGLMTQVAVHDTHPAQRHLRLLGADLVFAAPVVSEVARKSGTTLACAEDAQRLLADGELLAVFPEGFKGIGKPYTERYKLQRFGRGGFVAQAMRAGVPIVPVSIVGAEEAYPMLGNVAPLARLFGLPYVPVTPLFPWLGPLGLVPLPSKWIIEFGAPIPTDEYDADAADDPMLVFNLTDQVRETIQHTLYALLLDRRHAF